jgi:hypothetical protein
VAPVVVTAPAPAPVVPVQPAATPAATPVPNTSLAAADITDRNPGNVLLKAINEVKTLEGVNDISGGQPLVAAIGAVQTQGRPAALAADQLPMSQAVGDLNSSFKTPLRVGDAGASPFSANTVGGPTPDAGGNGIGPMRAMAAPTLQVAEAEVPRFIAPVNAGVNPSANAAATAAAADEAQQAALPPAVPLQQQLQAAGLRRAAEIDALSRALEG